MAGMRPRVSVVIATRDRRDELVHTVRRLGELPGRPPVIVVDNGSRDGSPDAVRAVRPDARVIRLPANMGAPARNVGVRAADTPYVAFSDDDSWWEPDALDHAVHAFDEHPRLGLIAASVLVEPGGLPDPINAALAGSPLPADPDLPGPPVLGFLACASVVRREAFLAAGGFDSVIFFAGEERLLAYDMAAAGWGVCHLPRVRAVHRPSELRPPSRHRRRIELRNDVLTVWLTRPPAVVLRQTAGLAARATRDPDARAALAAALRRLPPVLAGRRPLPGRVERAARLLERTA